MLLLRTLLSILFSALIFSNALGQLRLPALVSDSMVLQRDTKVKVWGWASKGQAVSVALQGKSYKAQANDKGEWSVTIPPLKTGKPFDITVKAEKTIVIKNVVAGDVWLCAGQSNMVHNLSLHKEEYAAEVASANNLFIRHFTVPSVPALDAPKDDFPNGRWKTATRANIEDFSVVAYFLGKGLYDQYRVPIGLINSSYGGTPIEAWISESGLRQFPEMVQTLNKNKDTTYVNQLDRAVAADQAKRARRPPQDKGLIGEVPWHSPQYQPKGWNRINIPGYWEDQGIRDLNGVVWYRRVIDVPASMTGVEAKVKLGRIVDADQFYVNGVLCGSTGYQYPQRRYTIPANVLKPGKNLLVVRVSNFFGKGGFVPDKPYYIAAGSDTVDLKGDWQYKVGEVFSGPPGVQGLAKQNQPSALFNSMVAPMLNLPIKGVAWYQGESNTTRAKQYAELLPALINDWRAQWKQPTLPFFIIQLPRFMDTNYLPEETGWVQLRGAQLSALSVPNTALIVTLDLGEWNDIHPGKKGVIGDRLALAARKVVYGEKDLVGLSPVFKSAQVAGNRIVVTFDHAGAGLKTSDGEAPGNFAIAGADKKFVWANAVIKGGTVEVWHDDIAEPRYVRYGWADFPHDANLVNSAGLPASPFSMD